MKPIKEKAKQYRQKWEAGKVIGITERDKIELAFDNGFRSAFDWISVEDSFPKESKIILVKALNHIFTAEYSVEIESFSIRDVTHWRYIDLVDYENHFKNEKS